MRAGPFLLLFGGCRLVADAQNRTAFLNLCLIHSISYRDFVWDAQGCIHASFSLLASKKLLRLARENGITVCVERSIGLPAFLFRHRRRAGLAIGMLLIAAMLFFSEKFIWDIEILGNESMTYHEVVKELRQVGFGVGSYIPDVRTLELENRVLIASDRISWLSIRIDGTVATVQILENHAPPKEEPTRPANVIATADGQIEVVQLYRGDCVVHVGQAVRAGDLLISGLYDSPTSGYRYTRAAGKVLARTERTLTVEIPLQYEQKIYEKPKYSEILLNFFDFSLKIFKKGGKENASCDIMKKEIAWELFGVRFVPIWLSVEQRVPYRTEMRTRSAEEATLLAYRSLELQMQSFAEDSQLLQKQIVTTIREDALVLECHLICIEDIAQQTEFEIVE
ncbi:MAG: sporulation protein YqfD [Clostridia bacterium]|nr:sporulation protein YqfD [Clostridia bacterium]